MKTLTGSKLLQDLDLRNGNLVKVGKSIYRFSHIRGTKWDDLTPTKAEKNEGPDAD